MPALPLDRRKSAAARWSRRIGSFSLVLMLVATAARNREVLAVPDFLNVVAAVAALAVFALVLAGWGFARLWRHGDRAGRNALVGMFASLGALSPLTAALVLAAIYPSAGDVSTDLAAPPAIRAAARDPSMNRIQPISPDQAANQRLLFPEVTGRRYAAPLQTILAAVDALVAERGWSVTMPASAADDVVETSVEAVAETLVLRFPRDVVIRLIDEDGATYVDMRSASRYGARDMGDNARLVAGFLDELDQRVQGPAPKD